MSSSDEPTSAGPGLAICLAVGLVLVILTVIKLWYTKYRRIQLIHAPPASSLPMYHANGSAASLSSSTSSFGSPVLGEFGEIAIEPAHNLRPDLALSIAEKPPHPALKDAENCTSRGGRHGGVLVGMFGSPDWEISITRTVNGTARGEVIAQSADDMVQRVQEMPVRALSRMSSRCTMNTRRTSADVNRSPYLAGLASARTSLASVLLGDHVGLSSPRAFPIVPAHPIPPKAQALLDIPETSLTSNQSLEDARIAVPPKARARLGMILPVAPPSPVHSEFSHEMQFGLAHQRSADALGFSAPESGSSSGSDARRPARRKPVPHLPYPVLDSEARTSAFGTPVYTSSTPLPPTYSRLQTFSAPQRPEAILQLPVPERSLAHQRVRSLDSLRRVRIIDPRTRPGPAAMHARAGTVGIAAAPGASRRSRSISALPAAPPAPARKPSTPALDAAPATPRKRTPPPAIQIISPSPAKKRASAAEPLGPFPGSVRRARSAEMLAPPDWGAPAPRRAESPSPTHTPRHPMARTKRSGEVVGQGRGRGSERNRTSMIVFPTDPMGVVDVQGKMGASGSAQAGEGSRPELAWEAGATQTRRHRRSYLGDVSSEWASPFVDASTTRPQVSPVTVPSIEDSASSSAENYSCGESIMKPDGAGFKTSAIVRRERELSASSMASFVGSARSRGSRAPSFALIDVADPSSEAAWLATGIDGVFDFDDRAVLKGVSGPHRSCHD